MDFYLYFKAFHIIATISWMVGLLYLPRLFVYHCNPSNSKETNRVFITMEKRLLFYIMNPAMLMSWIFGALLVFSPHSTVELGSYYFLIKLSSVTLLLILHVFFSICRKKIELGTNEISSKTFKILNEIPTLLLIIIVIMIVVRPI